METQIASLPSLGQQAALLGFARFDGYTAMQMPLRTLHVIESIGKDLLDTQRTPRLDGDPTQPLPAITDLGDPTRRMRRLGSNASDESNRE